MQRYCGAGTMTPAARLQAVIEILEALDARPDGGPAEQLVNDYLRQRRYIGSKDRRAVTAMTYDILRHRARLGWWLARAGASDAARSAPTTPSGSQLSGQSSSPSGPRPSITSPTKSVPEPACHSTTSSGRAVAYDTSSPGSGSPGSNGCVTVASTFVAPAAGTWSVVPGARPAIRAALRW